jgi:type II secretory pathway component PulF
MCAESAERRMLRFVTLAEPLMILGFGLLIGLVAVSLLQAVYSVNGSVAG